uniref:Peptidase A2 domain-containing protein n=2 Tax=Globodera rostochiensis TaxID=31243 RepID=A0A914HTU4_GLORO
MDPQNQQIRQQRPESMQNSQQMRAEQLAEENDNGNQGLGQRGVQENVQRFGDLRNPHPGRFRYLLRPRVNHPYYGYNPDESDSYSEKIQQIPWDQTYGILPQNERGDIQVLERHSTQNTAGENSHPILHPNPQIHLADQEEGRDRYGRPIAISTPVEEVHRLFVIPPPPQNSAQNSPHISYGLNSNSEEHFGREAVEVQQPENFPRGNFQGQFRGGEQIRYGVEQGRNVQVIQNQGERRNHRDHPHGNPPFNRNCERIRNMGTFPRPQWAGNQNFGAVRQGVLQFRDPEERGRRYGDYPHGNPHIEHNFRGGQEIRDYPQQNWAGEFDQYAGGNAPGVPPMPGQGLPEIILELHKVTLSNQYASVLREIPSIQGTEGRDKIQEFFTTLEICTKEWKPEKRLEILRAKLKGKAIKALNMALKKFGPQAPFGVLKTEITSILRETDHREASAFNELMQAGKQKGGEDIVKFGERIQRLVCCAYSGIEESQLDEISKKFFIANINDPKYEKFFNALTTHALKFPSQTPAQPKTAACLTVELEVETEKARALMDSGAETNWGFNPNSGPTKIPFDVASISGTRIPISGVINVPIDLAEMKTEIPCLITAESFSYDLVLGTYALDRLGYYLGNKSTFLIEHKDNFIPAKMNGDEELMDFEEEEDHRELERVQKLDKEAERKELERLGIIAADHQPRLKQFAKRSRSEPPIFLSEQKVPRHEMAIIERSLAMSEQASSNRTAKESFGYFRFLNPIWGL